MATHNTPSLTLVWVWAWISLAAPRSPGKACAKGRRVWSWESLLCVLCRFQNLRCLPFPFLPLQGIKCDFRREKPCTAKSIDNMVLFAATNYTAFRLNAWQTFKGALYSRRPPVFAYTTSSSVSAPSLVGHRQAMCSRMQSRETHVCFGRAIICACACTVSWAIEKS